MPQPERGRVVKLVWGRAIQTGKVLHLPRGAARTGLLEGAAFLSGPDQHHQQEASYSDSALARTECEIPVGSLNETTQARLGTAVYFFGLCPSKNQPPLAWASRAPAIVCAIWDTGVTIP